MNPPNSISLRDLAFVRHVLIPRAWVRGGEVDDLFRLRVTLDSLLAELDAQARPTQGVPAPRSGKKPRHPKPGKQPPADA